MAFFSRCFLYLFLSCIFFASESQACPVLLGDVHRSRSKLPEHSSPSFREPRVFLRGEGKQPRVGDVAYYLNNDRDYLPIRIDSVSTDGTRLTGVSLMDGNEIHNISISDLSRSHHPREFSRTKLSKVMNNFKIGDPIQLKDIDGELISGTFTGFSETGYLRIVSASGEKIGIFPESIVDGSVKALAVEQAHTLMPYHDRPSNFKVVVSTRSPAVAARIDRWKRFMSINGIDESSPKNAETLKKIEEIWRESLVSEIASRETSQYGRRRDELSHTDDSGVRVLDLGDALDTACAVCLEQSLAFHRLLSEIGFDSDIVTGSVPPDGRHAWVQVYDERGRSIGIIDSNSTKSFHPNFDDYRRTFIRIDDEVDDVIVEHRQRVATPTSIDWRTVF